MLKGYEGKPFGPKDALEGGHSIAQTEMDQTQVTGDWIPVFR